jgi:hypothetical protein
MDVMRNYIGYNYFQLLYITFPTLENYNLRSLFNKLIPEIMIITNF